MSWTNLHSVSPEDIVIGDLDGNGIDEVVIDFGIAYGLWVRFNNASWVPLHALSPSRIATGDLDNDPRDELIVDFPGYGIYIWYRQQQLDPAPLSEFEPHRHRQHGWRQRGRSHP